MCACEPGDLSERTAFDPGLMEPARALAARLGHQPPEEAWLVFFGLKGGAIAWSDLCVVKQSYDRTVRMMRMRHATRRPRGLLACEAIPGMVFQPEVDFA